MAKRRIFWIVLLVAAVHASALALIITSKLPNLQTAQTAPIRVDIVEIPPEPKAPPEPPIAAPSTIAAAATAPKRTQPSKATVTSQDMPQREMLDPAPILRALPASPTPDTITPPVGTQTAKTLKRAQIADVLLRLDCQKLQRREPEKCPKPDPFATATAPIKEVRLSESEAPIQPMGPTTRLSRLYMMPGMQSDLFVDGFAPGAYNAQRIRNGHSPIWDKSIEQQLRQSD